MDGTKTRTSGGKTLSSGTTAPLKPKAGLNGPQFLKEHDQQIVRLHLKDGEVVKAKILFVSETEQDVIVDLISSTNIARYQKDDVQPAFEYLFEDISWIEPDVT